jgi:8-oxo-dGTP pyrophosphatase MutT (NUDIX family)
MAGQEGAPAPEDPERRTGRRRRRRRSSRAKAGGAGSEEPTTSTSKAARSRDASAGAAARTAAARKAAARKAATPKSRSGKGTGLKKTGTGGRAQERAASRKLPTQREVSAGGVVYRRTEDGIEVVLASRRTRRGDLAWGLAKGGIEPGESREEAALREVREETGLDAVIEADLGDTRYIYVWEDVRIRKRVHFFLMRHTGGDVDDRDDEMEEVRWFPLERARKRAAYRGERDVLARAAELLR